MNGHHTTVPSTRKLTRIERQGVGVPAQGVQAAVVHPLAGWAIGFGGAEGNLALDDVGLHHQVFLDEVSGKGIVGMDAADLGRCMAQRPFS